MALRYRTVSVDVLEFASLMLADLERRMVSADEALGKLQDPPAMYDLQPLTERARDWYRQRLEYYTVGPGDRPAEVNLELERLRHELHAWEPGPSAGCSICAYERAPRPRTGPRPAVEGDVFHGESD